MKSWCSTLLQCLHAPRSGLAVVVPVPAGGRSRLALVAIAAVVAEPAASLRHIIIFYMQQKARRFGGQIFVFRKRQALRVVLGIQKRPKP